MENKQELSIPNVEVLEFKEFLVRQYSYRKILAFIFTRILIILLFFTYLENQGKIAAPVSNPFNLYKHVLNLFTGKFVDKPLKFIAPRSQWTVSIHFPLHVHAIVTRLTFWVLKWLKTYFQWKVNKRAKRKKKCKPLPPHQTPPAAPTAGSSLRLCLLLSIHPIFPPFSAPDSCLVKVWSNHGSLTLKIIYNFTFTKRFSWP